MALKFCPKCNYGTPQLDSQIKFCSNCGYNFISASMPTIEVEQIRPIKTRPNPRQIREEYDRDFSNSNIEDDEENTTFSETFEPPQIEIDNLPQRPTIKGQSLAFDKSPKENIVRPKLKKMNKKQVEEDFRSEVSKKSSVEIGGI